MAGELTAFPGHGVAKGGRYIGANRESLRARTEASGKALSPDSALLDSSIIINARVRVSLNSLHTPDLTRR
jgi:hypothetical protein